MKLDLNNLFDSNTKIWAELKKFSEWNTSLRNEVDELRDHQTEKSHHFAAAN